ncbi:MAG: glycosyl transferase family 2 [Prevotellaceae bacterium]|jgi:rhamnosyltransferase|nr:glycosyl transferase family 2 [Prevotellaceae bacterium]
MKLAAVVILYHPGNDYLLNKKSYEPYVDTLIEWDNTPHNVGIGRALNKTVEYARQNGYTHLLALDQDSYFLKDDLPRYLQAIEESGTERAIFSTNYYLLSHHTTLYPVTDTIERVSSTMTSGAIYPLSLFDELGLFMEKLFVWGIDMEFSWRAARHGIPTLCFRNIVLQHDLGYQRKKRFLLGRTVFPNEYSPARSYYNVRNGILLHRLYPEHLPLGAHLKYHLWKRLVFVLLYERQKRAKWLALWRGYRDGRRGKTGKYEAEATEKA